MFYYLSFLRPPQTRVTTSDALIKITPQISNDLRTELCDRSHDISYSWSLSSPPQTATKPLKLTTWKQKSSAYKELSVPLPPGVRAGQSWRLILTASKSASEPYISLEDYGNIGLDPFPVVSMPIQIVQRHDKPANKQEQVERTYKLTREPERFMIIRENTSFDLDKKVWDSGIGLSSWIIQLGRSDLSPNTSPLLLQTKERLFTSRSCHVIELGAGTGIVSVTLGAARSLLHQVSNEGNIFTTDLVSAMPLLSHNISANAQLFLFPSTHPQAFPLNWDDVELPLQVQNNIHGFDVILMADVTYNTSSFPSLLHTISSLIAHTAACFRPPPLILLSYKERDPDERSLWTVLKSQLGVDLKQVGECAGESGAPIEFWIGIPETPSP